MYCVYCITFPNNKKYIGKTYNIEKRKKDHKYETNNGSTKRVHNAIRKYGYDNLSWEILVDGVDTNIEINDIERYYISFYNTNNIEHGYNMTSGGDGISKGFKQSEDFCKKRSEYTKGENNPMYGKKHSKETIEKISKKSKERFKNPEKHPMYGKKQSEESKRKNSESNKKLYENGYINPTKGIPKTEEQKRKISKTLSGFKHKRVKCEYCGKQIAVNRIKIHKERVHNEKTN
jgi:group I intron endonuclease